MVLGSLLVELVMGNTFRVVGIYLRPSVCSMSGLCRQHIVFHHNFITWSQAFDSL